VRDLGLRSYRDVALVASGMSHRVVGEGGLELIPQDPRAWLKAAVAHEERSGVGHGHVWFATPLAGTGCGR